LKLFRYFLARFGKSWVAVMDHVGMGGWGMVIGSGGWHVMSVVVDGDVSPREGLGDE
jgi:hypothetical protein